MISSFGLVRVLMFPLYRPAMLCNGHVQVSFGPTIEGAHSPDEKVDIASVGNFWQLVLATLEGLAAPDGQ